jgi:toxin FitB
MNGWLLDTNVISERNKLGCARRVKEWFDAQEESTMFISVLVLAELEKSVHALAPADAGRRIFGEFIREVELRFRRRTLSVSDAIVRRWGIISGEVKRKTGHLPQVVDTLFAATAIEHELYLATRNVSHVLHSGAAVFNPWTDEPPRLR